MYLNKMTLSKVVILSCYLTSCYIQAAQVPSLDELLQGYVGIAQQEIPYYVIRNHLICTPSNITQEDIQNTLAKWYQENKDLRNYTISLLPPAGEHNEIQVFCEQIAHHQPHVSYADMFAALEFALLEQDSSCKNTIEEQQIAELAERARIVVDTLKGLGVKQTLSQKQIQLFARIILAEIEKSEEKILCLSKELLNTYTNQQ